MTNADWQEFRPRATQLTSSAVIKRLLWNPHWNETLFLVTCAERLISAPSQHSIDEINTRLLRQLTATPRPPAPSQYLYFRLAFWERQGIELTKTIEYVSEGTPIGGAVNDL
ncbi:hypothetical protein [Pacificibacter maritimus]|uniref:hypothetical protein n=1 Tax=Pacificibacter maritimus TaxID=762213 RepID=UPI0011CE822B|nr:hypothetical protein [Pacificibacter maritimus]